MPCVEELGAGVGVSTSSSAVPAIRTAEAITKLTPKGISSVDGCQAGQVGTGPSVPMDQYPWAPMVLVLE